MAFFRVVSVTQRGPDGVELLKSPAGRLRIHHTMIFFDGEKMVSLRQLRDHSSPSPTEVRLELDGGGVFEVLCEDAGNAERFTDAIKPIVDKLQGRKSSSGLARPALGAPMIPRSSLGSSIRASPYSPVPKRLSHYRGDDLEDLGGNNLAKSIDRPVAKFDKGAVASEDIPSFKGSGTSSSTFSSRVYSQAGMENSSRSAETAFDTVDESAARRARIDGASLTRGSVSYHRTPEKGGSRFMYQNPTRERPPQNSGPQLFSSSRLLSAPQSSAAYRGYRSSHTFGLQNLGNTCYLNAVMQALCSLREFVANLRGMPETIPQVADGMLFKGSSEILKQMSNASAVTGPLSPAKLRELIAKASPMFAGNQQQDAHEFLLEYVNQLHDELLGARKAWLDAQSLVDDEASGILSTQLHFDSEVQKTLACIDCQHCRGVPERFRDFSLDFPAKTATVTIGSDDRCELRSMLTNYFEKELLEVRCELCNAAEAHMSKHLTQAPRVLVLHLKRFVPNLEKRMYEKQHQNVDIPLRFNLKDYLREAYAASNVEPSTTPAQPRDLSPTLPARPLAAEAAQASPVWEVCLGDGPAESCWRAFAPHEARLLEQKFAMDPNGCCDLEARDQKYLVDFARKEQVNKESQRCRRIRRRETPGDIASGPMYELRSVVAHDGASPHSGHYVTYARGDTGAWRLYDDSLVKEFPASQDPLRSLGRKAYILFYVLQQ